MMDQKRRCSWILPSVLSVRILFASILISLTIRRVVFASPSNTRKIPTSLWRMCQRESKTLSAIALCSALNSKSLEIRRLVRMTLTALSWVSSPQQRQTKYLLVHTTTLKRFLTYLLKVPEIQVLIVWIYSQPSLTFILTLTLSVGVSNLNMSPQNSEAVRG